VDVLAFYFFACLQVSEVRPGALSFPRLPAMITRVCIGGVGRDDVADPTEQAARANPQARGDDEPQYTGQEATVIELSNSRDDRAENCRYSRMAHCYLLLLLLARPCPTLSKNGNRPGLTRHRSTDLFRPG